MAHNETVTVSRDDLDILLVACLKYLPDDPDPVIPVAFSRLQDARHESSEAAPEPPPPDGIFARVELPGWRNHTGWITDELRFGIQMAVVRDRTGTVLAEVALGPGCQIIRLAPPSLKAGPVAALPAGASVPDGTDDPDDRDDRDSWGEAPF